LGSGKCVVTVVAAAVGIILHDTPEISAKLVRACTWYEQEEIEMLVERETTGDVEITKVECDAYVDAGTGTVRVLCRYNGSEVIICELTVTETEPTYKSWTGSVALTAKMFRFVWVYHQDTARKIVSTLNRKVSLTVS